MGEVGEALLAVRVVQERSRRRRRRCDMCRWNPEPSSSFHGFPMNVARRPCAGGHLLDRRLEAERPVGRPRARRSGARLISYCAAAELVVRRDRRRGPGRRRRASISREDAARVGDRADGVDVARVVDVAAAAPLGAAGRARTGRTRAPGRARGTYPRFTYSSTARFSTARGSQPYGVAVHPLEVGDAPRHFRVPRDPARASPRRAARGCPGTRARSPRRTLWRRSTVMIASQWAAPSATRWSKNATGYSLPRAMPCRSG